MLTGVRRLGSCLAVVLAAAAICAARPLLPSPRGVADHQTLVVGVLSDPVTLDPHAATDLVSAAIVANVCEPLVRLRAHAGARPEAVLATTWATRDNREWTFLLREGVRFHDGSRFDADAVVANFADLRRRGLFGGRADRIGPHVVGITLDRPNAALLATLSQPFLAMQSPRAIENGPRRPVGTGPYRLASARPGEYELAAFPGHWGGAPRLPRVVFQRVAAEAALLDALAGGGIDVTSAVGLPNIERVRRTPGVTLDSQAGLNVAFLSVNNRRPPFDDVRVRQALTRLVDRRALIERHLGGHGIPAYGPLPPALAAGAESRAERPVDLPAARRLLARAGHASGFGATLLVPRSPRPYLPAPPAMAELLRQDMAAAGIELRVEEVASWPEYIRRCTEGDYDLALLGWQADSLDPNDFLSALVSSDALQRTNRSRYSSDEMDRLLERGRRSSDERQRAGVYREALALFQRDLPWVPLYHVPAFTAYRTSVQGLALSPTGVLTYDQAWKTE